MLPSEEYYWVPVSAVPTLAYDHKDILAQGQVTLRKGLRRKPICFELLPEKFTLVELQAVFEQGYDRDLDPRNFRRKVLASGLLCDLNEKRPSAGTLGKPPKLYAFNEQAFEEKRESSIGYFF